jgi:mediator of RNA polymerase II transcription subunit 21
MYATLNYIQEKHSYGDFPNQPSQAQPTASDPTAAQAHMNGNATTPAQTNGDAETKQVRAEKDVEEKKDGANSHIADPPEVFHSTMRELARGLILQEQKAEILINSLPGLGNSDDNQLARMKELEVELRQIEAERAKAEEERERMLDLLGEVIVGAQRVR